MNLPKHYIRFELTMPSAGSWNRKWSDANNEHYIIKSFNEKTFKEKKNNLIGSWCYSWNDGWTACVTGEEITAVESRRLKRKKSSFLSYDWMVDSIIIHGKIVRPDFDH